MARNGFAQALDAVRGNVLPAGVVLLYSISR